MDENIPTHKALFQIFESITNSEIKSPTEVVEEGIFDRLSARYNAHKSDRFVDKSNKFGNKKLSVGADGKGKFDKDPTNTAPVIDDMEKHRRRVEAISRTISKSIYKDLRKLGVISSDDANYQTLLDNFLRVIYILSNMDADPYTGKSFTWTRVDRNLIGKFMRPYLEAIVDSKTRRA